MNQRIRLTCRDALELSSLELDQRLPIFRSLFLKLHLIICGLCRTKRSQLERFHSLIQRLCLRLDTIPPPDQQKLSDEARKKIIKAINKAGQVKVPKRPQS